MADIFSEVDEGLRQDRATDLWKKWGPFVIGAAALLVAAVAVWEYMKWTRAQAIESVAQEYSSAMDALEGEDLATAQAAFSRIADGEGGYATIAGHMAASIAQSQGDEAAAIQHLQQVSAQTDNVYSELAILKSAYLQADTVTISELETIVAPLMSGSGPTDALARELLAAKALSDGDIERARRDYQTLQLRLDDGNRLPEFQQRVQRAMLALPPPAGVTPEPAEDAAASQAAPADALANDNQDAPAQ